MQSLAAGTVAVQHLELSSRPRPDEERKCANHGEQRLVEGCKTSETAREVLKVEWCR